MKILVVASLTPPATANYLIDALRDAKHEVFVCSDVASPLVNQLVYGAVDIARVCARHKFTPELMLFIEGGTMRLFPTGLENLDCLTAWYGIDTHMDYAKHLRIGRLFDVTFIAQKEFVEKLRIDGLRQVFWLPLAFAPELHPQERIERVYEVAYVGSDNAVMHPVRHALLAAIRREISNVYQGMASPREMGRIYAQAKMVFNKSVNNDVNMRYFEAMGAGAVLLTDHAHENGAEELFTVGEHFLEYEDENSLISLIKELSRDSEHCRQIGEAAHRHVLEHHTYTHRANYLLELVKSTGKTAKPAPDAYFSVFTGLHMAEGALQAARDAFDWQRAGRGQRLVARMARAGLVLLILGAKAVERTRNLMRVAR
jgi:hypothetical protein